MGNINQMTSVQKKKLIAMGKLKSKEKQISKLPRSADENIFPVTPSQRRLWFMYQMKPDSIEYNVPFAYRIFEKMDRSSCIEALRDLVKRHEILRTTYREQNGEPVQVVHSVSEPYLEWIPEELLSGNKEKDISERLRNFTNCSFDLENGPLFKTMVIVSGEISYLAMTFHHSIIDSWSVDIIKKEFSELYLARSGRIDSEMDELKIQYADYSVWYNKQFAVNSSDERIKFWTDKLENNTPVLDLPFDYERPAERSGSGYNYKFELSEQETEAVKKSALNNGCTLFIYLLSVYQVLLYHYTLLERITVGTTITSRPSPETEKLIGFFINNIVYNTEIDGDITFSDFLKRVKIESLQMFKYQDVPFENVVRELHVKRDLSRTAVFQVMFNYLGAAGDTEHLYGIESEEYELGGSKATTDLNLFAWENKKRIIFNFEYSTDLFRHSTIERFAGHLKNLIMDLSMNSSRKIGKADFLTKEEKSIMLDSEINTVETADMNYTALNLFEKQVLKTPDSIAVHFEGKTMTYAELNRKANITAAYLLNCGLSSGDTVGLYMDRSMEMIIGMISVMKAGAVYVPLDPTYPEERIEKIVSQADIHHILTQRFLLGEAPSGEDIKVSCIDTLIQKSKSENAENPGIKIKGEDLMYILFTSGSTGEPKGVMIRHRNYASYFKAVMERTGISEPLSYIIVTTFAADLGSFCIYAPLLTGGCVHIASYEHSTDPQWLADYFERNHIDVIKMVPSHFEALQASECASSIIPEKMIIFAGEAVSKDTVKKVFELNPSCRVINKYGPSETTVTATLYEVKKDEIDSLHEIPLGRSLSNTYAYVLNRNMDPVPYGVAGELYLGGEGVCAGYLGRSDLTSERFLDDPFHPEKGYKIYKTGDMVRLNDDGNLMFIGRADRQVKIRGYRIELGAIEKVLRDLDQVEEAVVNVHKEEHNQSLCAYVTLKPGTEKITSSDIRKMIKSRIPDYWMPGFIAVIESVPLTANGKIDYKALPEPTHNTISEETYTAPRNDAEKEISDIWSEVLGIPKIGIDDNFFDLGGESFKAMKMIRKIGHGISIIDLFKYPTIRELSERIAGNTETEKGRLVRLTPKPAGKVKMNYICFPFAGGSAVAFQPLANEMPSNCQLFGVRIPGHDYAFPEDTGGTIDELVTELVAEVKEKIDGPVSVYAQCVAGALGVAFVYALERENIEVSVLYEAANFPSPRLPGKLPELWSKIFPSDIWMSNRVYRETLKSLGNSDETSNSDEEKFIIAGIRHDARMSEDYFSETYYKKDFPKIKAPVCCLIGERDRTTEFYEERYHEWEHYSDKVTYEVISDAGHFFHKHQPKEVCGILTEQMIRQKEKKGIYSEDDHSGKTEFSKPLSLKLFFFIMLGQVVSILGSNLSSFAIGIWLYGDTGSIGNFSMVAVATLVPSIILAPFAGMIADRYDKRKIMILGDLFAITGTLLIFLMYSLSELQVWHVCIGVIITAIGGAFQRPAFLSAIPVLVPKYYLGQANGIMQFASSGGEMLGPVLGAALLFAIGMKGVLFLDFLTCFVSVATLAAVRFPERAFKKREEPFRKELVGGWNYIIKRHSMVVMVVYFVVANFLMSLVTVVFSPLAIGVSSEKQLGFVLSANAAGVVAGSVIMSLWGGTKRRADGMVGFLILTSVSMIIMGIYPSGLAAGAGLFLFGMSIAFVDTHWQIMIQSKVGLELQGRVFSINEMLVSVFRPAAFLIAPLLCERVFTSFIESGSHSSEIVKRIIGSSGSRGIGLYVICIGFILLLWAVIGMKYRPLRYMEDYLPDAIPGAVIYGDKDKMQEETDKVMNKEMVR